MYVCASIRAQPERKHQVQPGSHSIVWMEDKQKMHD